MIRIFIAALAACAASSAHAYCVYNETDREVSVVQERHPNAMRDERKLKATLAPKGHVCCEFHKLDCNPEGRTNGIVNLEMRIGKTRIEALRELARRTGLEDIKSLVAMLVQTDRFGTSVAQALRVHSDSLRTERRQRAEEQAAKTTIKMVPPLVVFVLPSIIIVTLGPAIINLYRTLTM